jgi:hypothetical protein
MAGTGPALARGMTGTPPSPERPYRELPVKRMVRRSGRPDRLGAVVLGVVPNVAPDPGDATESREGKLMSVYGPPGLRVCAAAGAPRPAPWTAGAFAVLSMRFPASRRPPGSLLNGYRRRRRLEAASVGLAESRHGRPRSARPSRTCRSRRRRSAPLRHGGGRQARLRRADPFMPGTARLPARRCHGSAQRVDAGHAKAGDRTRRC